MILTNAQRGDLIDALEIAIANRKAMIDSNLRPSPKDWNESDREDFAEWSSQRRRFHKLRKRLLAEEKSS